MVFAEDYARWLLVAHAVLGVALVASTTHLVVWLRRFPSGKFHRIFAVRRFARISLGLYLINFLVGNLLYPTYKVDVRVGYLEDGSAVTREWQERREADRVTVERYRQTRELYPGTPSAELPDPAPAVDEPPPVARTTAKVARWFDVKEHWVALGLLLSLAAAGILHAWNPVKNPSRAVGGMTFGLAFGAAAACWIGAIVGLVVSSFRAVGPVG